VELRGRDSSSDQASLLSSSFADLELCAAGGMADLVVACAGREAADF